MAGTYRIEAIILKRINYGETDKILTVFSKQRGKVCCLAKGIRKINSRRAPSLELFNQASLFLVKGKSLSLVTETKLLEDFPYLRKNFSLVRTAYYLVELINCLTAENQESLFIYKLLVNSLRRINERRKFGGTEIIDFQKSLLTHLGFGLPAKQDLSTLERHIESILDRRLNSEKFLRGKSCEFYNK